MGSIKHVNIPIDEDLQERKKALGDDINWSTILELGVEAAEKKESSK